MASFSAFYVSTATNSYEESIDLLSADYQLAAWETGVNEWKDGGIYSSNPLTDGSIPVDIAYSNFEEKISVHITGASQDNVISNARKLLKILDEGIKYFINNESNPSYLVVKGDRETSPRYAVIAGYKIDKLPGQFTNTFVYGGSQSGTKFDSIMDSIELVITRDVWLNEIPGTGIDEYINNSYVYNGNSYGQESSNSEPIYIISKNTKANLTDVYIYDASSTSWSDNIATSTSEIDLLPNPTDVGDCIYFGCNSSLDDSGMLSNIIFDIETPAVGISGTWEYHDGGTWRAIGYAGYGYGVDNTQEVAHYFNYGINSFSKVGLGDISYLSPQYDQTLSTIATGAPSVDGYWIRYKVSSVSSPVTPRKTTRPMFSITKPYVILNNTGGDLPSLSKVIIRGRPGPKEPDASGYYYSAGSILLGVRSLERGSKFTPYINAARQNPSGIDITYEGSPPGYSYEEQDYRSPTGFSILCNVLAASEVENIFNINFDSTITNHFMGKFRCFFRYWLGTGSGNEGDVFVKVKLRTGEATHYESEYKALKFKINARPLIADMGIIDIPSTNFIPSDSLVDIISSFSLNFDIKNVSAYTNYINITDIVLIPIDESVVEVREFLTGYYNVGIKSDRNLEIDSLTYPLKNARAITRDISTGNIMDMYRLINTDGIKLPNRELMLCFMYMDRYIPLPGVGDTYQEYVGSSLFNGTFRISIKSSDRYLLPIG